MHLDPVPNPLLGTTSSQAENYPCRSKTWPSKGRKESAQKMTWALWKKPQHYQKSNNVKALYLYITQVCEALSQLLPHLILIKTFRDGCSKSNSSIGKEMKDRPKGWRDLAHFPGPSTELADPGSGFLLHRPDLSAESCGPRVSSGHGSGAKRCTAENSSWESGGPKCKSPPASVSNMKNKHKTAFILYSHC